MEFNQMAKDLFTEEELAEIQAEADRLAEQMLKEQMKKELLKQATARSLATKKAKIAAEVKLAETPDLTDSTISPIFDTDAKQIIAALQKEKAELEAEVQRYKAALSSKGFKLNAESKVISSDARAILENLGVSGEDIEGILGQLRGDEQYDEIKEIASQYLEDKYSKEETVIENKNQIIDFTNAMASF